SISGAAMRAGCANLAELADADRQVLEAWLVDFDQAWSAGRLAARARELPPRRQRTPRNPHGRRGRLQCLVRRCFATRSHSSFRNSWLMVSVASAGNAIGNPRRQTHSHALTPISESSPGFSRE